MDKIVVVGSSGSGKTTLAKILHGILHIKVFHLDRLFWQANWKKVGQEDRTDTLQAIVMEKNWIIDGTYLNSSDLHLNEANTIIFLDIHPLLCCYRIIMRQYKSHVLSRRDIPLGSKNRLTLFGILKVLLFPLWTKIKLENKLRKFPGEVIWLHSRKEAIRFLAQFELRTNGKAQSSPSGKKKSTWFW